MYLDNLTLNVRNMEKKRMITCNSNECFKDIRIDKSIYTY